jgi:hypothetical protein
MGHSAHLGLPASCLTLLQIVSGYVGVGDECTAAANALRAASAQRGTNSLVVYPTSGALTVCWTPFAPASAMGTTPVESMWWSTVRACSWGVRQATSPTPFSVLGPFSTDCRSLQADLASPGSLVPGQLYVVDVWAYAAEDTGGVPDAAGVSAPFVALLPEAFNASSTVPLDGRFTALPLGAARSAGANPSPPQINSYCGTSATPALTRRCCVPQSLPLLSNCHCRCGLRV